MTTEIATQQPQSTPLSAVGMSRDGTRFSIAPENLGEVVKFAEVMSRADIAIPKHLRGNPGACMAVTLQALGWQMDPFMVASKSYSVSDRIAYEAQLIAAVVNTRSGIKGRLRYAFEGEGAELRCTVSGELDGEECVYVSPKVGQITTKNSPLWKTDPQQQLGYYGARSWARRHCPEVILGVYDREEAEEFKDVTPQTSGFADRLANNGNTGGFDPVAVDTALQTAQDGREGSAATSTPSEPKTPVSEQEKVAGADTEHDPDMVRAGATAASDGEVRETPDGLSPADGVAWLVGYDGFKQAKAA